jgi:hypothetical protein
MLIMHEWVAKAGYQGAACQKRCSRTRCPLLNLLLEQKKGRRWCRGENVVCAKRFELYPRANHARGCSFPLCTCMNHRSATFPLCATRRCESSIGSFLDFRVRAWSILLPYRFAGSHTVFYLLLASKLSLELGPNLDRGLLLT